MKLPDNIKNLIDLWYVDDNLPPQIDHEVRTMASSLHIVAKFIRSLEGQSSKSTGTTFSAQTIKQLQGLCHKTRS